MIAALGTQILGFSLGLAVSVLIVIVTWWCTR